MANSVAQMTVLNVAVAPMVAMGMVDISMANSIGNMMANAVSAQQNCQVIENASVTQCCALMIAVGIAQAAKG